MDTTKRTFFITLSGILVAVASFFVIIAIIRRFNPAILQPRINPPSSIDVSTITPRFDSFKQFASDEEFIEYVSSNQARSNMDYSTLKMSESRVMNAPMTGGGDVERVSETNTQVFGIDEPDIVKTDAESLYYSLPYRYPYRILPQKDEIQSLPEPMVEQQTKVKSIMPPMPPREQTGGIAVIDTLPVDELKKLTSLNVSGDLLLAKNILVVFDEQNYEKKVILGYDVTDPSNPKKKWSIAMKKNVERVSARLYGNKVYLISKTYAQSSGPCPILFMDIPGGKGIIPCTDIYRPPMTVNADSVYTAFVINPVDGEVEKNMSFVGSSNEATVYMSRNALYIGYYYSGDMVAIMYGFMLENKDMFSNTLIEKLGKIKDYDISQSSKLSELTQLLSKFTSSYDEDKKLAFENNLQNRMKKFMELHSRELERTGIVKIDLDSFRIDATGDIPGKVLNQFAFDEYKNNLRVATTIGQNSWFGQFGQLTQSFSEGYVVTFRQTDPLYVIDLSRASNPYVAGQLKIPGYSAYLHPLTETLLLGVGKEGSNVKLSLFDVSDSSNPTELDTYMMNEYWSEALNNHHAFLSDEKHSVIFIPGSKGGYVISYSDNKLSMKKAVADTQVKRAVYINDYLYVIGENKIVVLDENSWDKVKELEL